MNNDALFLFFLSFVCLEVWLSGLRHWFAKSTYNKIVSWVRIPFPPAQKLNGRAKLRERKNL